MENPTRLPRSALQHLLRTDQATKLYNDFLLKVTTKIRMKVDRHDC